jgi:hypothetical protein
MSPLKTRASAGAIAAAWLIAHSQADAHAVCGSRVFPATLVIDDPGVNDELALPTLTYLPKNADGVQEFDAAFSYTKTIIENLGLSLSYGKTWLSPGGNGWGNLDTELKYQAWCVPSNEFMGSVGLAVTWANTGSPSFSDPFNTFSPVIDIGKGFGDLPTGLNALRPFAITAEFSLSAPSQPHASMVIYDVSGNPSLSTTLNPTVFNWGFTLQYSLQYMNANVQEVGGPEFLRHLVFIIEAGFQTPISNVPPGGQATTGVVQPGVMYMADTWQISLEAVIPINGASGHNVGVEGELHFFLDDMFPNTLGRPLFAGGS